MTLPPPPDSFFDGGKPNSQVDPGDTGRELLHEVKNLAQAVILLQTVIVPRHEVDKRRRNSIILAVLAMTLILGLLGIVRSLSVQQTRDRINSGRVVCSQDVARGRIEIDILRKALAADQFTPQAHAFYDPEIHALEALQQNCDGLYPLPGHRGWPSFWNLDSG